ncbi:hypothetical protein CPB83DRAFT_854712 [Crepidotus variabilis]|uniref:Uncharacterized protein n=1 Tax=Crepidotus variabilis TaxID=179855 RepID=A0A9P6EFW2_9AGAR|nr:hypothetical protein CPB83DRAFT_854712 [Crepidotus variabilis]
MVGIGGVSERFLVCFLGLVFGDSRVVVRVRLVFECLLECLVLGDLRKGFRVIGVRRVSGCSLQSLALSGLLCRDVLMLLGGSISLRSSLDGRLGRRDR